MDHVMTPNCAAATISNLSVWVGVVSCDNGEQSGSTQLATGRQLWMLMRLQPDACGDDDISIIKKGHPGNLFPIV